MAAEPILFLPEAIKGTISAASYSQPIYSFSHLLSRSETNNAYDENGILISCLN